MEVDKTKMKSFETSIFGKKQTVHVSSEIFDKVVENIGRVVEIECNYKINDLGEISDVYDVTSVESRDILELWDISYKNEFYSLKEPLNVKVETNVDEENHWVLKNDDLEIISLGEKWDDAFNVFSEEFCLLVREFVNTDEKLSLGAKELQAKLLKYLRGGNEY